MNQESKTTRMPQPSHPTQTLQSPQSKTVDKIPEQVSTATPTRKRQIDNSDSDDEPLFKRARLTRKNLTLFDKMGKKTSNPTDDSKSTKTTSTTSSGFAEKARNNGILHPAYSKPPKNLEDIRERHSKTRATASPPESTYEDYINQVDRAGNEVTLVVDTSRKLLKEYIDKGYNHTYNRQFTGIPRNAGFNDGLSAPQPDYIEGLEAEEYRPFPVNGRVPGAILYKDDPRSLALPHLAGEWKGPDGNMEEARMQSAYDGAAMVHARTQALAYMGKSDPPGYAAITTFTTDGTNLNLYAHYAAPSAEDEDTLEYHQYPVSSTDIKGTYQGHKDGRKSLRNAQDRARDQSYDLKNQLKEHWKQNRNILPPVAEGINPPTDMEPPPHATDGYKDASPHVQEEEDEEDYEVVQPTIHKESSPHSKSSHRRHSSSQHSSHHHYSSPHHFSSKSSYYSSSHSHSSSSSGQKRKASSSQTSSHGSSGRTSKHGSYWKKNSEGYYYHKHSDGTISWLDGEEDERD